MKESKTMDVPLELIVGLEGEFSDMTAIGQRFARWVDRMVVSPAGLLHMCVGEGAGPVLNRLVGAYAGLLVAKGTGEGTEAHEVIERVRHDWAEEDARRDAGE